MTTTIERALELTPFHAARDSKNRELRPLELTPNRVLAVVQDRPGRYDVYHRPSGRRISTTARTPAGDRNSIGTACNGDGWRTQADAHDFMHALNATGILRDTKTSRNGMTERTALNSFINDYRPLAPRRARGDT